MNVKNRIKRNKLDEIAGEFYLDESSLIAKALNELGVSTYVGIGSNRAFTMIGDRLTYFKTLSGKIGCIEHEEFLNVLQRNAYTKGKNSKFEEIPIGENILIWVNNGKTMTALWNTIMFFYNGNKA